MKSPAAGLLTGLITAQAARTPDAVAIRQGQVRVSYAELLAGAAGVAAALREHGAEAEDRVGVCGRRTPALITALLGVLLAGAAYVPLDPAYPARRLRTVEADAGAVLTLADETGRDLLTGSPVPVLPLIPASPRPPAAFRPPTVRPGQAAYVMYTSGSTGRPKGVVVSQASLAAFVTATGTHFGLRPGCRAVGFASVAFDVSVLDVFVPLAYGGAVQFTADEDRIDPVRLQNFLETHEVTWGVLPPAVLPLLDPARLPALADLVTAGEPPAPDQVARWTAAPAARRFHNWYGPTETTVCVTGATLAGSWDRPLPIGTALADCTAHVLGARLQPCPPGEPGELCIGGAQLARGYLGQPGHTAERFIADPFGPPGARLYRTGDRAAWGDDGLTFLGRLDRQLKIRGQRVEAGEAETVLASHPAVRQAAATAEPGPAGQLQLVAYLVLAPGTVLDDGAVLDDGTVLDPGAVLDDIRAHCATRLPAALVPARLVSVPALPLTVAGKIDLAALRATPAGPPPRTYPATTPRANTHGGGGGRDDGGEGVTIGGDGEGTTATNQPPLRPATTPGSRAGGSSGEGVATAHGHEENAAAGRPPLHPPIPPGASTLLSPTAPAAEDSGTDQAAADAGPGQPPPHPHPATPPHPDRDSAATTPRATAPPSPTAMDSRAEVVAAVREVWEGLFGVGVEAEFLAAGGDSLLAMRLVAGLVERTGRRVAVEDVFAGRSVAGIAARVVGAPEVARAGVAGTGAAGAGPPLGPELSAGQRRLWFTEQLSPGTPVHNVVFGQRLRGRLDVAALRRALRWVAERQDVLRWRIRNAAGVPEVMVADPGEVALTVTDLTRRPAGEREPALAGMLSAEAGTPFDLVAGPLWRVRLARLGDAEHALIVSVHHIVFDGWSQDVLYRDLAAGYRAGLTEGELGGGVASDGLVGGGPVGGGLASDRPAGNELTDGGPIGDGLAGGGPVGGGPAKGGLADDGPTDGGPVGDGLAGGVVRPGFADYVAGLRERQATRGEAGAAWWAEHLAGAPPVLDLPRDRARPPVQSFRGADAGTGLGGPAARRVRAVAATAGATPFAVLLAAFGLLVGRLTGQDDLVVGTPVADRADPAFRDVAGFFLHILPLRLRIDGKASFTEHVRRAQREVAGAFGHADTPLDRIVAAAGAPRDLSRNPLIQVLFNAYDFAAPRLSLPGLAAAPLPPGLPGSLFDLTLYVSETPGQIAVRAVWNPDLYDVARIEDLLASLAALLERLTANPEAPVDQASLRPPGAPLPDGDAPLPDWTGPGLAERVQAAIAAQPDAIAISGPAGTPGPAERETLRYRDVAALRDATAAALPGIAPGGVVAVLATRDVRLPAVLLGVHAAGARWLILDLALPPALLARQLTALRPAAVISFGAPGTEAAPAMGDPAGRDKLAAVLRGLTVIDARALDSAAADPAEIAGVADLAGRRKYAGGYLMLTSGTGGRAAVVRVGGEPLAHFLDWYVATFGIRPTDRFALLAGLGHDPALRDMFAPLAAGARLCVPEPGWLRDPVRLVRWLRDEGITVVHLTPQLGRLLMAGQTGGVRPGQQLPALRLIGLGGDQATGADVAGLRGLAPGARVVGCYGATETPQVHGWYDVPASGGPAGTELMPAGCGIEGSQLIVLGRGGQQTGVGELGEVVVRSRWLAGGYSDAELTQRRFGERAGVRTFRTGDLGRYLPSGAVVLAGRADDQVKIRGYRVALGEVEAALRGCAGVGSAHVIVAVAGGERMLRAFVVPTGPGVVAGGIIAQLRSSCPDYAVPAEVTLLPAMPLTPNGKVDRAALARTARRQGRVASRAPASPAERMIAAVWRDVLGLPTVGATDNFFEIGGHSLAMAAVQARLTRQLDRVVPIVDLFRYPSVQGLAAHLDGQAPDPAFQRAAHRAARRRVRAPQTGRESQTDQEGRR